jgi:DNA-binding transcriptional MerR regulator
MLPGVTIKEACALVKKSRFTIHRWKRQGLNIQNVEELLKYSAEQDERACGKAFELQLARANGATLPAAAMGANSLSSYFSPMPPPDEWVDLPCPFRLDAARQALAVVEEMKAAFNRRLVELRQIGHALSIDLGEEELATITESARLLEMAIGGWDELSGHR